LPQRYSLCHHQALFDTVVIIVIFINTNMVDRIIKCKCFCWKIFKKASLA